MEHSPIEEIVHLYVDGQISRRSLMTRIRNITGSTAAAVAAISATGMVDLARAADSCPADIHVPADAEDLSCATVTFDGPTSKLIAYHARPRNMPSAPQPAVLVIHENVGLTDHIRDVTRRVARAGFPALGIDLLSRLGGTDSFPDANAQRTAYGRLTAAGMLEDMIASIDFLRGHSFIRAERMGCVGFCAGGGNVWNLAVSSAKIAASSVFYGPPVPVDQIKNLAGPILLNYAELDKNFTKNVLAVVPTLVDGNKTFGLNIYEGANHAFHNDTGANYRAVAACDAWGKTIDFFTRHLRA